MFLCDRSLRLHLALTLLKCVFSSCHLSDMNSLLSFDGYDVLHVRLSIVAEVKLFDIDTKK